ncbi:phospholipid scramblase 1 [Ixodes scapularis]|uniref:phospholipid scramblase 1 n=1 Tax=Ixodes scapularis TaxID=6945 RepID=UPI001C38D39D|nr:phospholipid scramblase 1 [Ixodes scapularis]
MVTIPLTCHRLIHSPSYRFCAVDAAAPVELHSSNRFHGAAFKMMNPSHIPPGLEYLGMIDQIIIKQKVELLEVFTGFETANKYAILNSMGQDVFFAAEDSDCCTRNCCGSIRPFGMKIMDNTGREVMFIDRPLRCDTCWFPCCLQTMEVMAPPGSPIGYLVQEWSILYPKFRVENAAHETVLRIEGPACRWRCCSDVVFQVLSKDGLHQVGKITKQWSGLLKEAFTDADNFGVSFPMDLDVNIKGVLVGAAFLIDFMFFEKQGNRDSDALFGMC